MSLPQSHTNTKARTFSGSQRTFGASCRGLGVSWSRRGVQSLVRQREIFKPTPPPHVSIRFDLESGIRCIGCDVSDPFRCFYTLAAAERQRRSAVAVNGEHAQAAPICSADSATICSPRSGIPAPPRKNSLTLLQEVKSVVKDSRSLPFVTKHPGTWKKTRGRGFVKLLLLRPRQSNDGLSKFGFLDLPSRRLVERAGSCIIFHQHLVAFTGSALLWLFTS